MISEKKMQINSFLMVFMIAIVNIVGIVDYFTDIYGILISMPLILIILMFSLFNNNFYIDKNAFVVAIFLIIYFAINLIFATNYFIIALSEMGKTFIFGFSAVVLSTYKFNLEDFQRYWFKFSIFFLIIFHLLIREIANRNFSYMDAGFLTSFIIVGISFKYWNSRNKAWLIMIAYVFILGMLFGHRGGVLVNVAVLGYFLLKSKIVKRIYIVIATPIIALISYLIIEEGFLIKVYDFLIINASIFNSRSLRQMLLDIQSGELHWSGRDELYSIGRMLIEKNHFIFPNGFGKFQYVSGAVFPHNIILDIYLIFGALSIVGLFYFVYQWIQIRKNTITDFQLIFEVLNIYMFLRLMTGGTFTTEASFWIAIGLTLSFTKYTNQNTIVKGVEK